MGAFALSALKVAGALAWWYCWGAMSRVRRCALSPARLARSVQRRGVIPRVWLWFALEEVGLSMAMGAFLAGVLLAARNIVMRWKAISNPLKVCCWAVFHWRWHVDRLWHAD